MQFWAPQNKSNIRILAFVRRRATKLVKALKDLTCEELMRRLDLFSLQNMRLRGDLIAVYHFLMRGAERLVLISGAC